MIGRIDATSVTYRALPLSDSGQKRWSRVASDGMPDTELIRAMYLETRVHRKHK